MGISVSMDNKDLMEQWSKLFQDKRSFENFTNNLTNEQRTMFVNLLTSELAQYINDVHNFSDNVLISFLVKNLKIDEVEIKKDYRDNYEKYLTTLVKKLKG